MKPQMAKQISCFEFGPFRLDQVKRLLTREGQVLPLTQKAFDTLLILVRNSDRVVDKDELMRLVWPDTVVEENNLTQSISALRKALGERRKDHKYIVTIQGRGYRFVADVRTVCNESIDLTIADQKVTGETQSTVNAPAPGLLQRNSLRTRAVTAIVLSALICGGIYWWRNGRTKSAELSARARPVASANTHNAEAYQAYVKGRYFWNRRSEADLVKAIEYFRQAIELDQNYALAHAGLADAYLMMSSYGYGPLPPEENAQIAKSAAIKALELDETLAEAHTSMAAVLQSTEHNSPNIEREYKRAIELNPNYATARQWYGEFLRAKGRFDDALVELKRAQELAPLSPIMNSSLAVSYYYARQYDLVIEQNRKALEIDPNFTPAHFGLGLAFEQKGMYEDAIAELQRARELSNGGEHMMAALGHAYAKSGDLAKALRVFRELKGRPRPASPYSMALLYVAFGQKDKALPLLQKARLKEGNELMLKLDPRLDSLRSDSAFSEVFKS